MMKDDRDYKKLYLEQKSNFLTCRLELLELRFLDTKKSLQEVTNDLSNHKELTETKAPDPPPPPPKRVIREGVKIKKVKK